MDYIHDRKNWPKLTWSPERLAGQLPGVRHRQGRLIGRMEGLGFSLRNEAVLQILTEDVLKSSEIEGFEGKLTSSKWAKLAKCSQDTALRDIDDLVKHSVLLKEPGSGRSTNYGLADRWTRSG